MRQRLHLDLSMGAAGDMLAAALYGLLADAQRREADSILNGLAPGLSLSFQAAMNNGLAGTKLVVSWQGAVEEAAKTLPLRHAHVHGQVHVHEGLHLHEHAHEHLHAHPHEHEHEHEHQHDHDHVDEHSHEYSHEHGHEHGHDHSHEHSHEHGHHHGTHLSEIRARLERAATLLPEERAAVYKVYEALAGAESKAHGLTVEQVHFHEVGEMDALADIAAFVVCDRLLGHPQYSATPVHLGSGRIQTAHGILPVPAPATAELLKGLPVFSDGLEGELCTPTGAALLKTYLGPEAFAPQPAATVLAQSAGLGTKVFAGRFNAVRALLYAPDTQTAGPVSYAATNTAAGLIDEEIGRITVNIDDMSGEDLAHVLELAIEEGALDATLTSIMMKKGRPAYRLELLYRPESEEQWIRFVLFETSSHGLRVERIRRLRAPVEFTELDYQGCRFRLKRTQLGESSKLKFEYADLKAGARALGLSITALRQALAARLASEGEPQ